MRIQLLCDQKWRDLPNLVAVKSFLQQLGHRTLVSSVKDYIALAQAFRPDCLVMHNLFNPLLIEEVRAFRNSGVAIVQLPTEGAVRPEYQRLAEGEFSNFSVQDLYLSWNELTADGIRARLGCSSDAVPVVGCGRMDFYSPRYAAAVLTRAQFCAKYGLDPAQPIICWATAYAYAYFHNSDPSSADNFYKQQEALGIASCLRDLGVNPRDVPSFHHEGRETTAAAFFELAKAMPQAQFIIKPHPVENRDFYRSRIREYDVKNVRFCPQEYIWNVLSAVDVHLHRHCTTACEAWAFGRPTIEMGMDFNSAIVWPEREVGSHVANTSEQLIHHVRHYIEFGASIPNELKSERANYLTKWFGPLDGRRNEAIAQVINDFLRQRGPRRKYFSALNLDNHVQRGEMAKSSLRWLLNKVPDASLRGRKRRPFELSEDKLIKRSDVRYYEKLLAPATRKDA